MSEGGAEKPRLCAVSVDLDEIPFYRQIHGLAASGAAADDAVFDVALPRLDQFARDLGIPLTLFVIGETLRRRRNADIIRGFAERGHEIGNHTLGHRYDLTRLPPDLMQAEIEEGQRAILEGTGVRPVGFRAPGYTMTDELVDVVTRAGFLYDSSVFPCPAYWTAKVAALSIIRMRGRKSRSVLGSPNVLRAPRVPYRVGRPYWTRGSGPLELPIQVTPGARLPFIGTALTMAGPRMARLLSRMVSREPLVNLELHGIDVLDRGDGLHALARHQRDLKIPHTRKLETLSAVVETLRQRGYSFVRLDEAARAFSS
jgi:peptidoglycan/xylan/chitin deacetylase (PgdA/CDA1 family)